VDWIDLISQDQLKQLKEESFVQDVLVFKHSTRCSVSSMALSRLERSWNIPAEKLKVYFLDLLRHRELSDKIAEIFAVEHQSPQVLLVRAGNCIYHNSHNGISATEIAEKIRN
jgi:bacillithiol system protein YtxJ